MKAVIPAAGLGTRFLPATKAQPKEMLPVVDKPTIQYVVEEAVASDIDDILIVTGRGKRAIEDHFDKSFELEHMLELGQKPEHLNQVRDVSDIAHIHYIRQKHQLGLGDAIYCAHRYVGQEPFAVLLGDTITLGESPVTKQLIKTFEKYQAPVIAVEKVPQERVEYYGIVEVEQAAEDGIYKVKGMVEKPSKEQAASDLAIFGRYILTPQVFACLEETKPGKNGEIQLTDALALLLKEQDIYAYEVDVKRYDIGNKLDWLKATLALALEREDIGPPLLKYIRQIVKQEEED